MTRAEWDARKARVDVDLAILDSLVDQAYRNTWFRPWRSLKQRCQVEAELARLRAELDTLLAADIEFPNP